MNSGTLLRGISKTLMGAGAIAFFFGDRALREFWHVNFALAELGGIGGGVLLMILGGALQTFASKRRDGADAARSL